MPKEYPSELLHFLISEGVQRVVVGHTPHGNCPTVIPHDGLCVIMGDTSYSNMKSEAWLQVSFEKVMCHVYHMYI